ncbi:lysophospholipid acyltransferase 1 isoform X2 [Austrofundulus limnaeus]|uniref:Lysophospholipid acyltransferase 1 isoform X2 n=1 Tax=Austrofundulus limnaeus TaxID=52670 RepID=A0A2I4BPR1_AUSLI|nr:PREDICTED: lysophospholipid acyltransferase 1 isoform X2 [Austrofundulus limnaeus]
MSERATESTMFKTTGSKLLLPASQSSGLSIDQVNFLACQFFALAAAFWFRLYLSPSHASPLVRHAFATLLGTGFLIFCFGWYSAHILTAVAVNYLIIIKADMDNVHRPLMIVTQKITMLAFQLHDGLCKKSEQLTSDQKFMAIKTRPSLLEYLSYNLNFLSVLVGPCSNYQDYIDFIEGRHISRRLKQHTATCNGQNGHNKTPDISPFKAVCRKLLVCCGCLLLYFYVTRSLPITFNVDPDFLSQTPFLYRLTYAFFSIQAARPKFYFAWTLADAVNNAAGYGFEGLDASGKPSWDLVSNINIVGIETATSFKTFIDNWNIQTGIWLKTVCYDRAPKHRLALTFVLSALWHGVYPGYYFTFITAIPITMAARAIRRSVRHYFLGSRALKLGYDIVTWAATQLTICYTVMPFLLLSVDNTLLYYRSMYFHVHILSLLAAVALHRNQKPRETSTSVSPASSSSSAQLQPVHSNNNVKVH